MKVPQQEASALWYCCCWWEERPATLPAAAMKLLLVTQLHTVAFEHGDVRSTNVLRCIVAISANVEIYVLIHVQS